MWSLFSKVIALLTADERNSLIKLTGVILLMGLLQMLGVAAIMPFMTLVSDPGRIYSNELLHWLYRHSMLDSPQYFLFFMGVVVLAVFVFSNLFAALTNWMMLRFSARQNYRISTRILANYLQKPYPFFLNHHSADLVKNALVESTALTEGVVLPGMQIVAKATALLFICAMLIWLDPLLASIVALVLGGAYAAIYYSIHTKLGEYGSGRLAANTARFKTANEMLGGIKEIKLLGREKQLIEAFRKKAQTFSLLAIKNQIATQLPRYFLEIIAFGGILLVTIYLIGFTKDVKQVIPVLSLYAFAGYRLLPLLQEIYLAIATIKFNQAVVDVISKDLHVIWEKEQDKKATAQAPMVFNRDIVLDQIRFAYQGVEQPAIDSLSVRIQKNTTVAFVGSTGAGKTTLVDLILGLLHPERGQINIDDTPLTAENSVLWRDKIAYVPQDIFLIDDSITANIALGVAADEIDMDAVITVANIANVHDFVERLPEGYNTFVGERGVRLSGGQKQRIGIARALYTNPDVLVLDEATSALDGITEDAVMDAIHRLSHQKTIIMIAHRLTTVKACDVIYMLEQGQIVDQGSYQQLVERNQRFREMAKVGEVT